MKLSEEHKPEAARRAFARGCDEKHRGSCTMYALMLVKGEGGPKDEAMGAQLAERSCAADDEGACLVHGLLARDGVGITKDVERAIADFDKACRLGKHDACDLKAALKTDTFAEEVSSKTLSFSAEKLSIDGLDISKLDCKLVGAKELASAVVIAKTLSSRAPAMKKCTKKSADVTISWESQGAIASNIKVECSDAAIKTCVEKALAGSAATVPGSCSAVLKLAP
jgi:hypothetical protein